MAEEVEEEVEDILKEIRDLLLKERKEKEVFTYFTYPANGGTKEITETLEINVYTGEVFADGTEEYLSGSLQRHGLEYARSLFIRTDKAIKIQLDDGGQITISASKVLLWGNIEFQRVMLTIPSASSPADIAVLVSNKPDTAFLNWA